MSGQDTAPTLSMPVPPAGPVPARISRRTRVGSRSATSCATKPRSEKPRMSTRSSPSARIVATVSEAISATVSGGLPPEAPMPR